MKKVIIAGGRDFQDEDLFTWAFLEHCKPGDHIVHGMCPTGADRMAELFGNKYGYSIHRFEADWNTHGKAAGPIRNKQMAQYADVLVAFWDGKSRGTKSMIEQALEHGLEVHVYRYTNEY